MIELVHLVPAERVLYSERGETVLFRVLTDFEIEAVHDSATIPPVADLPFEWYISSFYRKSPDEFETSYECVQKLSWIFPDGKVNPLGKPTSFTFSRRGQNVHVAVRNLPLTSSGMYQVLAELFVNGSSEPLLSRKVPILIKFHGVAKEDKTGETKSG